MVEEDTGMPPESADKLEATAGTIVSLTLGGAGPAKTVCTAGGGGITIGAGPDMGTGALA